MLELSDISVMAAHAHYDKSFAMTVTRPADVLAYYRDDLASLVSGDDLHDPHRRGRCRQGG